MAMTEFVNLMALLCVRMKKSHVSATQPHPRWIYISGLISTAGNNYWDVPFPIDQASMTIRDSSSASPLTVFLTQAVQKDSNSKNEVSPSLLPGFSFKSFFSYRKYVDI